LVGGVKAKAGMTGKLFHLDVAWLERGKVTEVENDIGEGGAEKKASASAFHHAP